MEIRAVQRGECCGKGKEGVCSPAPSASSWLFSECHSLHYQSKVGVCLCAHHLLTLAGFCFAVIDKSSASSLKLFKGAFHISFRAFFFSFMIVHTNSHCSCLFCFAHLFGRDSHEQNTDTTDNEAIMVRLSVYLAIFQFNNLWLPDGVFAVKLFPSCEESRLSERTSSFTAELCILSPHYPVIIISSRKTFPGEWLGSGQTPYI